MDQTLIQEILEVVEQAAIASAKLSGKGLKNEADAAAVEAMRKRMGQIAGSSSLLISKTVAICIAVGIVSFDDCDLLISSLG